MKLLKHDELISVYQKAESVDSELFSEQRSNLLLVAGEHYSKKGAKFFDRVRDSRELTNEQKIRITKNHIQKISKIYVNNIINNPTAITAIPNNPSELQDQKAAQLNKSVLEYGKRDIRYSEKRIEYAEDFINIGEVAVKIFWDPWAGQYLGSEEVINPETGEQTSRPKFSGALVPERVFGFNLLRAPEATSMGGTAPWMIRKMVDVNDLKKKVGDDPEKLKLVTESEDKTLKVFDGILNGYREAKDQTLLIEWYYPKCEQYPNGYFYIGTLAGTLWHGEIPFGVWPIIYGGFDSLQTTPRSRAIIKQLRPYQIEINRSGSKMAEHQITLGDDKLLVASGSKVASGVQLPGVRAISFSGAKPEFLAGRSGEQYLAYMNSQISEMYQVAGVQESLEEKAPQGDLLQSLYRRINQKKSYSLYLEKFQNFELKFWETWLELAKNYFSEDQLIPMIGRNELVNISEFKNTEKLCYQINLEPHSEDVESMMGKQIVLNHALQYVGPQLDKKSIGKLMRAMPFGNLDESFSEFTIDEDTANNLILALDRGQVPLPNRYDDGAYIVKKLTFRTRQPDYIQLDPQIQKNYDTMIAFYEKMEVAKQREIMEAQKGFIPSGGARVKADYYVTDPNNPNKTSRAELPAESIDWLIRRLAEQGTSQEQLQMQNQGAVAEMAAQLNAQQGQGVVESYDLPRTNNNGPASPDRMLQ